MKIFTLVILIILFTTKITNAADKVSDMRAKCQSALYVSSVKNRLDTLNKSQLDGLTGEINNGLICVSYLSGIIEMMFNACGELATWKKMLKDKGVSEKGIAFYSVPYKINSIRATGISSNQMAKLYLNSTDKFPNYWDTYQGARIFKNHLMKLYPCDK